jgi:hypothetical protein
VGERSVEADSYDRRYARTSVPHRKWWRVPDGPLPCSVCGADLTCGTKARRSVVDGEVFYRHPGCTSAETGTDSGGVR